MARVRLQLSHVPRAQGLREGADATAGSAADAGDAVGVTLTDLPPGEVPGALLYLAHPSNYRVAHRQGYDRLVIHCTDGRERALPVAEMFSRKRAKASSAHFTVGQAGEIIQSVRLKDVAYHAHTANSRSVGIEHCARTPGELYATDPGLRPSEAQYQASATLVAWLLRAANLPATREVVLGHREADQTTSHDRCPDGCGWAWQEYMTLVRRELAFLVG